MSTIKCKIMRNRNLKGGDGQKLFPKVVKSHTLDNDYFVNRVADTRNLNEGQVKAVLTSAAEVLADYLAHGHGVHIGGLGTFTLTMRGDILPDTKGVLQLKKAQVRSINFLPDVQLKQQMRQVKFKLESHEVNEAKVLSDAGVMAAVSDICQEKQMFTVEDFVFQTGASDSYARRRLAELVEDGRLQVTRFGNTMVYSLSAEAE